MNTVGIIPALPDSSACLNDRQINAAEIASNVSETNLLRSSSMEPEIFQASTLGVSIAQYLKNITRKVSASSTKKSKPIHGQSAIQISVVIPTHCRPHLLRNCMQCLAEQSFDKNFFEVIVVSDGHDEETKHVVNSFKQLHPAVYYLHLAEKKGPAAARNMGWQRAWGKLVAFTNDDCLPDKHWLASLYKTYRGEEEIAYAGRVNVPLPSRPTDHEKKTSDLEVAEFVTANCCCTKMALEKVDGFDERFSMASREDCDLEFKLLQQNVPVVSVEEAVVVHPMRPSSWGASIKEQKKGVFNALLYKKFPELYRKKVQTSPPWNYYMVTVAVCCLVIAVFLRVKWLAIVFAVFWIALTVNFIATGLRLTTRKINHVLEMIVTSMVIPFVSVYWQLYGAIKYRTLFL